MDGDVFEFSSCLNESPYEKVGKFPAMWVDRLKETGLNESPYEKVGKSNQTYLYHLF